MSVFVQILWLFFGIVSYGNIILYYKIQLKYEMKKSIHLFYLVFCFIFGPVGYMLGKVFFKIDENEFKKYYESDSE